MKMLFEKGRTHKIQFFVKTGCLLIAKFQREAATRSFEKTSEMSRDKNEKMIKKLLLANVETR